MQHISGKLSTSSFQRYKVCANRSSEERVMAPGSRGVGAVFVCFSGEDSGQTGDAIGEPRVPHRSWSHYLSNAPRLAGQLVASRKDSAREGGSCAAYFCKVSGFTGIPSLGSRDMVPRTEATGVFLVRLRTVFRSGFRLDPVKSWRSESSTSCMNVSSFQRAWACGSTCCESGRLCAQAWQRRWESSGIFSTASFRRPVFTPCTEASLGFARYDLANRGRWNVPYAKGTKLQRVGENLRANVASPNRLFCPTTLSKIWLSVGPFFHSFDHNSLVSRPFLARKVSNRSSHRALHDGQGVVSSIQLLVRSTVWSNLGQTWSTLVKLGRIWSKLSKLWEMYPGPHFEGFWAWWTLVGSGRLGSGCLVLRADTRENPVVRLDSRASPSGVQMDIPRVEKDRARYKEAVRGSKGRFSAEVETRA
uniref:Uncharacterized protein n=1 Tax=Fagus sylvatica TaxID=28930 RepID=A0A2N9HKK9_FAGSY